VEAAAVAADGDEKEEEESSKFSNGTSPISLRKTFFHHVFEKRFTMYSKTNPRIPIRSGFFAFAKSNFHFFFSCGGCAKSGQVVLYLFIYNDYLRLGKIIASCFAIFAISFFALPAVSISIKSK